MIVNSPSIRCLLVSCCILALIAPDIARAGQSALETDKAVLQSLINQYETTIRRLDGERLDEGHRLANRFGTDKAGLDSALERSGRSYIESKQKLFAEFKPKRDALAAKIAQEESSQISASPAMSVNTRPENKPTPQLEASKVEKPDPHKFVSAAEEFVNKSRTSAASAVNSQQKTAADPDEEFRKHQKWIAEQDAKEHQRQLDALHEESVNAVHASEAATAVRAPSSPNAQTSQTPALRDDDAKIGALIGIGILGLLLAASASKNGSRGSEDALPSFEYKDAYGEYLKSEKDLNMSRCAMGVSGYC